MPTLLADSRRFLVYVIQDYCPIVYRRFHPSEMYIMSQSILSYFSIDTPSPSVSAGRPGRAHAPRDANPLKQHKAQYYRKRAAPENEDDVKSKVRKVIKPDRPASTQKELRPQSGNSTVLKNREIVASQKVYHRCLDLQAVVRYPQCEDYVQRPVWPVDDRMSMVY